MSLKISPTITVLVTILVVLIANNNLTITEAVDTRLVADYCSEEHYEAGEPYGDGVVGLLQLLVDNTANAYRYDYDLTGRNPHTGETVQGHAECRETLEPEECTECLVAAKNHLLKACALSVFAWVELADCYMEYANGPFTG